MKKIVGTAALVDMNESKAHRPTDESASSSKFFIGNTPFICTSFFGHVAISQDRWIKEHYLIPWQHFRRCAVVLTHFTPSMNIIFASMISRVHLPLRRLIMVHFECIGVQQLSLQYVDRSPSSSISNNILFVFPWTIVGTRARLANYFPSHVTGKLYTTPSAHDTKWSPCLFSHSAGFFVAGSLSFHSWLSLPGAGKTTFTPTGAATFCRWCEIVCV